MKQFEPIKTNKICEVPPEYLNNNDVSNLYHRWQLAVFGPNSKFARHFDYSTGKVTPARWTTTADNILCLWMQTEDPDYNLTLLVTIIVKIYCPLIFKIKMNWQYYCGPHHLFGAIKLVKDVLENYPGLHIPRKCPDLLQKLLETLKTNGFFAHPEHILVSMLHDHVTPGIKDKALEIVANLRSQEEPEMPRKMRAPISISNPNSNYNINIQARQYWEMVDLDALDLSQFTSPPILSSHTLEQLKNGEFSESYLKICCHSQHVERWVGITSDAALHAIGKEKRHSYIINKEKMSNEIPINFTKSDWQFEDDE